MCKNETIETLKILINCNSNTSKWYKKNMSFKTYLKSNKKYNKRVDILIIIYLMIILLKEVPEHQMMYFKIICKTLKIFIKDMIVATKKVNRVVIKMKNYYLLKEVQIKTYNCLKVYLQMINLQVVVQSIINLFLLILLMQISKKVLQKILQILITQISPIKIRVMINCIIQHLLNKTKIY